MISLRKYNLVDKISMTKYNLTDKQRYGFYKGKNETIVIGTNMTNFF